MKGNIIFSILNSLSLPPAKQTFPIDKNPELKKPYLHYSLVFRAVENVLNT